MTYSTEDLREMHAEAKEAYAEAARAYRACFIELSAMDAVIANGGVPLVPEGNGFAGHIDLLPHTEALPPVEVAALVSLNFIAPEALARAEQVLADWEGA